LQGVFIELGLFKRRADQNSIIALGQDFTTERAALYQHPRRHVFLLAGRNKFELGP
jgi:hypothetical protein